MTNITERFSIKCRKTKTKPETHQLDYSASLKPSKTKTKAIGYVRYINILT